MAKTGPLYLGFDLSTQQLKAIAVDSSLRVQYKGEFHFDRDSRGFNVSGGVIKDDESHEVYAPVAMWLQALDSLLDTLRNKGLDFSLVKGISGACQQHGSVFWSSSGIETLRNLDSSKGLESQLDDSAFSHPYSPNWQDTSTQEECDKFDQALGSPQALAEATGSSAHHVRTAPTLMRERLTESQRFTGPQILRFQKLHPDAYKRTARISLVSSFLASILLGKIAPIDIADVCGMNLWDIKEAKWSEPMTALAAGSESQVDLLGKLGDVSQSGGEAYGEVAPYFVRRYGFAEDCRIIPFTGDNPATILALPLRPMDAIVSLGTSTTFLMSTTEYKPDPSVHFMNHPTTSGLYMFMLCYKNGGLAREKVRDAINRDDSQSWEKYEQSVLSTPRMGIRHPSDEMKLGLYFPLPEIVPRLQAGDYRFTYNPEKEKLTRSEGEWWTQHDSRAMIEGQMLSLRLRSQDLVRRPESSQDGVPPQPRRIYLVGGGSRSPAIAKVASEVLGGVEGIYRLDVGENACALGAAYKAVWGCERQKDQSFEELISQRWRQEDFAEKIEDGYQGGVWERYASALEGFEKMEQLLLKEQGSK